MQPLHSRRRGNRSLALLCALALSMAAPTGRASAQFQPPYFTPADYFAETSVGANYFATAAMVDSHFGSGPQMSQVTLPPFLANGGGAFAGVGLDLRASASGAASAGAIVLAGGVAGVFNRFMLLPSAGFASPTAHITVDLLLDGILTANGSLGCGVPQCATMAKVTSWLLLPPNFVPDPGTPQGFDFTQTVTPQSNVHVHVPFTLAGTIPVGLPIQLVGSLETDMVAASDLTLDAAADAAFDNALSFGVCSSDPVSIVWASDQFFPRPPSAPGACAGPPPSTTTPEPGTGGLLSLGMLGVAAVARRRRRGT